MALAFSATAVSCLFAQAMLVRYTRDRRPQHGAWAIALAMFALASAALSTGVSTGWDRGTFRAFYLFGAILDVPWLALGTLSLHAPRRIVRRVHLLLLVFSGFAAGVLLSAPMEDVSGVAIPVGKHVFGALPRILAATGSGLAAVVIIAGAVLSASRFARDRVPGHARLVAANVLIAAGTVVLSSGGLVQGAIGHDESFTLSLTGGIVVIYAGFALAGGGRRENRFPADEEPSARENHRDHRGR